jgi:hypothetical protein
MPPFYRISFLLAKPSVHHHLLSRWFNQFELIEDWKIAQKEGKLKSIEPLL